MNKSILVTGGAGYIGSHTVLHLLNLGKHVVVMDNLRNSNRESLSRVEKITGKSIPFLKGDICNKTDIELCFDKYAIDSVIHFAGLKAVAESVNDPLLYYRNNVNGTLNLCEVMAERKVQNLVFSSSATVYGEPQKLPLLESMPSGQPTNPYGRSKLFIEQILQDISQSDPNWRIVLLRYFNPVGAHRSGLIGEAPNGIPNNLMPVIAKVAAGELSELKVFGDDYETIDGFGVRDFIHVVDLARGHVKALGYMQKFSGIEVFNLGTGHGVSVYELIKCFEKVNKKPIPFKVVERRPGDVAECYADTSKAERVLGWKAKLNLEEMCQDVWNWQARNPNGYD